jgi:hypothetical protein
MPRIEEYADAPALTGSEFVPVSVQIAGQYVTRRTTTQAIANKAPSTGGSGGAVDPYDAIRSWLPPYSVSAAGAAADNTAGINSAISAASSSGGGSGRVLLPQGRINTNAPIVLRSGVNLIGQGTSETNGTELYLANGSNCHVIQDNHWTDHIDYLDWAGVSNLRINGNKAGNPIAGGTVLTRGCGIAIYAMGEEVRIQNCNIRNCGYYGLYVPGPSLCGTGRNITTIGCDYGSIGIVGTDGSYVFDNVRAEIGGPLFQGTNGNTVSVVLNGCRQDNCGSNSVINLTGWRGCIIVNGGVFRAASKSINNLVNIGLLPTTGSLGPIIFPVPVYQQNFVRHLLHPNGGDANVEFETDIASGGWTTAMWYPGDYLFLRSGMRIGLNPNSREIRWRATEGNITPNADTWGLITPLGFKHPETSIDRYTHTTVTEWVGG